jgi:thioredoxin reductase (NADPH)
MAQMSKITTGSQPLRIIDDGSAPAVPARAPIAMKEAPEKATDGAPPPRVAAEDDGDTHARVVIVGSGPAGLTAAIYAARADLAPIVIAGFVPGGQLMITSDVENYPGFPEGIQGPELMDRFRQQAERFGARMKDVDVESVDLSERPFRMTAGGTTYTADALIVATGASAIWLELDAETRLRGRGVSACATCDGFFFRDRKVAVVGGGDSALEEALFLTKFADQIVLVHRRDQLRGSRIMQNRALDHPKISLRWNKEVVDVLGEDRVTGLRLRDTVTGEETEEAVDGLFVAIGHKPNTDVFRDWLEVDAKGYLVVHDETLTAVEGVFVAGDVHDHRYRQAVTAAGDGCKAAIDAERWLEGQAAEAEPASMAAGSSALAAS